MLLLALLLQAAVPPAPAPPSRGQAPATIVVEPVGMFIAACDADQDGRTDRAELDRCVRRSFEAADTQKAGQIGYIGFADWSERWLGDRNTLPSPFETDANGDDRISLVELQAKLLQNFMRLDRDRDGHVTRAECLTIRAMAPRAQPAGGRRGRGRAQPDDGAQPAPR